MTFIGLVFNVVYYFAPAAVVIVVVRFKAVGNAPIMKQNFYKITASNRFQAVIQFLRKELGWKQGDPLVSFCCLIARKITLCARGIALTASACSSPTSTSRSPQLQTTPSPTCSR